MELPNGTFSSLPFDHNPVEACRGYVRIRKGQRCALYVHGKEPGAVVYRHPVRYCMYVFMYVWTSSQVPFRLCMCVCLSGTEPGKLSL